MNNLADFKIGDWVVYLPEPEKKFEIVAIPGTTHKVDEGVSIKEFSVSPGHDFLLRRGGSFDGFEPYKSARKSELQLA